MFSKTAIENYFTGEKRESIVFIGIGVLAIITAIVFFFWLKISFYKGAALPLFFIGLLLSIVGVTVYNRSDGDRIRNVYAFDMNPAELKEKEYPRMKKVMQLFVVYRYTELIFFLTGIGLYLYFIRDIAYDFWRGFGVALALMALLALTADYFAEKRGKKYIEGIESFITKH